MASRITKKDRDKRSSSTEGGWQGKRGGVGELLGQVKERDGRRFRVHEPDCIQPTPPTKARLRGEWGEGKYLGNRSHLLNPN